MRRAIKGVWLCGLATGLVCVAAVAQDAGPGRGRGRGSGMGRGSRRMGGHGGRSGRMHRGEAPVLRLKDELKLTDEQVKQIRQIVDKKRPTEGSESNPMREAHQALRDAVNKQDEAAVREAAEKMKQRIVEQALKQMQFRAEVRKVLTPEQQKKLHELRAEHRQKMAERRESGRPRRGRGLARPGQAE